METKDISCYNVRELMKKNQFGFAWLILMRIWEVCKEEYLTAKVSGEK